MHGRMPTEAEWEYACRAGNPGNFCFGDDDSKLGEYAWYDNNSGDKTHSGGLKKPNAWGLCDMHGNVWEWCLDWYGPYPAKPGIDPTGPVKSDGRVLRGGAFIDELVGLRFSSRNNNDPDNRNNNIGFRVVCAGRSTGKVLAQIVRWMGRDMAWETVLLRQ